MFMSFDIFCLFFLRSFWNWKRVGAINVDKFFVPFVVRDERILMNRRHLYRAACNFITALSKTTNCFRFYWFALFFYSKIGDTEFSLLLPMFQYEDDASWIGGVGTFRLFHTSYSCGQLPYHTALSWPLYFNYRAFPPRDLSPNPVRS